MGTDDTLRESSRRAMPLRGLLNHVATRIAGGSYRQAACVAQVHISGTELEVRAPGEAARVRILPERPGYRVEIVVDRADADHRSDRVGSVLARWIWQPRARRPGIEDAAWARKLTHDDQPRKLIVDRSGPILTLAITVRRLPTAAQLIRWLDAARVRLSPVKVKRA
jgi:hypothetical protein